MFVFCSCKEAVYRRHASRQIFYIHSVGYDVLTVQSNTKVFSHFTKDFFSIENCLGRRKNVIK